MVFHSAQAALLRQLRAQHPAATIPPPVAFHISRHGVDPLAHGAYSGWSTNATDATFDELCRPLRAHGCKPNVWLSGEGTCGNFNGFVHAGLLSGRREARSVLHALGRLPHPPPSLCDAQSTRLRSAARASFAEVAAADAAFVAARPSARSL